MKIDVADNHGWGWTAVDDDTYDGPGSMIGHGDTPEGAILALAHQLLDDTDNVMACIVAICRDLEDGWLVDCIIHYGLTTLADIAADKTYNTDVWDHFRDDCYLKARDEADERFDSPSLYGMTLVNYASLP